MPGITLIHFIRVSGSREGDKTPHAVQYHFGEPLPLHPHCACTSGLHPAANTWFFRFAIQEIYADLGPLAPGAAPVRKPLENLRLTVLR